MASTEMTLDELFEMMRDQARSTALRNKGEHVPIYILDGDKGLQVIATPWQDNDQKHLVSSAMMAAVELFNVTQYAFATGMWFAIENEPKGPVFDEKTVPPSQRSDRQEGVLVYAEHKDGRQRWGRWSIARDKGKVRVRDFEVFDHAMSITGVGDLFRIARKKRAN